MSDAAVIDIEGVIGVPEQMQFERPEQRVATYARFTEALREIKSLDAGEITVNIRSTGGDVNDALLIYDALAGSGAAVTTRCMGYVASAATIIAQAASPGRREISPNALYLIHCSESVAEGNSMAMERTTQMLEATDGRIAGIYAERSGKPVDTFAALMNENGGRGRWLSAQEAVEAGLADAIMPSGGSETAFVTNFAELDSLLEMLGLPTIPQAGESGHEADGAAEGLRERLARLWRAVLEFLGAQPAEPAVRERHGSKPAESRVTAGGRMPRDKAVLMERATAQNSAHPTEVKPREDPSLSECRRTANEQAYENDLAGFGR